MKSLTLNPTQREEYGKALKEWADSRYNFWAINAERRELYRRVCGA